MADFLASAKNSPAAALEAAVGEKFVPGKAGPNGEPWQAMQYSEPEIAEIVEKYGVNYRFIYGENPAPHRSGYWYIGDNKNLVFEYGVGYRVYDKNQPGFFSAIISDFAPIAAILAAAFAVSMYVGGTGAAGGDFLGSGITAGGSEGLTLGGAGGISVPAGGGVGAGLSFDGLAAAPGIAGSAVGSASAAPALPSLGGLLSGAGQVAGVVGAVAGAAGSVAAAQNAITRPPAAQGGAGIMPLVLLGGGALALALIFKG